MKERRALAAGGVLAVMAFAGSAASQTPRWIEHLGDRERSEPAEMALVVDFEASKQALGELLQAWKTTSPRDLARLQGALRVVELVGLDAAELVPQLQSAARPREPHLPGELASAFLSLLPGQAGQARDVMEPLFRLCLARGEGPPVQMARAMARMQSRVGDADAARAVLATDKFGAREAACDAIARFGDVSDVVVLRDRLLARDRPAADPIRHNGFVVAVDDQFAMRAALAITRLAPDSPDAAIAYAILAQRHPHRAIRLRSLRTLASFGPAVAQAIPELLTVAAGTDEELALAALQALLPAGPALAAEWSRLEALAATSRPRVAAMANRLVTWLVDHLVERPRPSPAEAAAMHEAEELRAAVAALADGESAASTAAVARLQAAGASSWPFLVDGYRRQLRHSPEALFELLGQIGRLLPAEEHVDVREALSLTGDLWTLGGMRSERSGGGVLRPAAITAYGRLVIGAPTLSRQIEALQHESPVVRVVAARELAGAADAVATAVRADDDAGRAILTALLQAAESTHPQTATFRLRDGNRTQTMNVTAEIRAHAAAALVDCEVPAAKAVSLFARLDALPDADADAAVAARALARWADGFDDAHLEQLGTDKRPAVATTAAALRKARRDR